MRTVEVLFVVIILLGAFLVTTQFAVLPSPRQIFGTNLRELAGSTLQTFDVNYNLSRIAFKDASDPAWGALQKALSASLPPNIVYNLTVFSINSAGGSVTYDLENSVSNFEGDLGVGSEAASCLVTSSKVTFSITPEKIGEKSGKNITLYILNCEDANGWWITGYTGQGLAADLCSMLSPYFTTTILVNSTNQLRFLLDNSTQIGGTIQNAVVLNTFGEAVPMPAEYYRYGSRQDEGYDSSHGSYARYFYTLGVKTRTYNWTWVSIVGYPFYYVTNTVTFEDEQNGWGVYGMRMVSGYGLGCFLRGFTGRSYSYVSEPTRDVGVVYLSSAALDQCNYYGIYPAPYQTSTRAISNTYGLDTTEIFNRVGDWIPAATYSYTGGGAYTAIGLTRIPDIRVTVLGLLMYYSPQIYKSEYGASDTSRLVTLQLAQQGGT
jgi:hypothetical protein